MKESKVYMLRCGKMIKIGYSNDVEKRRKTLLTGAAYPISIERIFDCHHARRVESWLHQIARPYKGDGGREWFQLPTPLYFWIKQADFALLDRLAIDNAYCWRCEAKRKTECFCVPDVSPRNQPPTLAPPKYSRSQYSDSGFQQYIPQIKRVLTCCLHCGQWKSVDDDGYCNDCRELAQQLDRILHV